MCIVFHSNCIDANLVFVWVYAGLFICVIMCERSVYLINVSFQCCAGVCVCVCVWARCQAHTSILLSGVCMSGFWKYQIRGDGGGGYTEVGTGGVTVMVPLVHRCFLVRPASLFTLWTSLSSFFFPCLSLLTTFLKPEAARTHHFALRFIFCIFPLFDIFFFTSLIHLLFIPFLVSLYFPSSSPSTPAACCYPFTSPLFPY